MLICLAMSELNKYKKTMTGCYLGLFLQAFTVCCPPILFVTLYTLYGISFTKLGILVLITFVIQIFVDVGVSPFVDRFGFRPFLVTTPYLVIVGTVIFVLAPVINPNNPYPLIVVGSVFNSLASGLLEVLVSPIMDNLPTPNKATAMTRLHGFYGVWQIVTVLFTTIALYFLGHNRWQIVMSAFLAVPVVFLLVISKAPIIDSRDNHRDSPYKSFLFKGRFWIFLLSIIAAAVIEQLMAQWASTFFETALHMNKLLGDICAVGLFAGFFTAGRLLYGRFGERLDLAVMCMAGSVLCAVCYTVMSLVNINWLSVAACALSGLGASLLWPGSLALATGHFKNAGTKFFGSMSSGGDLGCAFGPFLMGLIADNIYKIPSVGRLAEKLNLTGEALGLKAGLLLGVFASILAFFMYYLIFRLRKKDIK